MGSSHRPSWWRHEVFDTLATATRRLDSLAEILDCTDRRAEAAACRNIAALLAEIRP
jgi:hypothetical protein